MSYKVVNIGKKRCKLLSARTARMPSEFVTEYKVGEWVHAPIIDGIQTPLFTFKKYQDAVNFCNCMTLSLLAVYRCQTRDPILLDCEAYAEDNIGYFWRHYEKRDWKQDRWFKLISIRNEIRCSAEVKLTKLMWRDDSED